MAVRTFRSLDEVPPDFGPSALTIGNFDGVHAGHRRIFRRVRELAGAQGWNPSVLTFDPHPTRVVAPQRAPRLMTTCDERAALMAEEGIEQVLILPFDAQIAQLSPERFVDEILVGKLGVRAVAVGDNFRFGHKQAGNIQVLRALGERFGFTTEVISGVTVRGVLVSSSELRRLVEAGNVTRSARLLGRAYSLAGDVVPGHGVGQKQTVPTLNLRPSAEVLPKTGVYVTCTDDLDGRCQWQSVTNVGYRPTFGGTEGIKVETYLLGPLEGTPPTRIRVSFLWRLRDERKFESPEALKAQIFRDVARAQAYFRHCRDAAARRVREAVQHPR
jgi:riboflavin kinase / FMN adenylyltransferase